MEPFVRAFLLIFVAEMGDKSQLLALAFATKYPLRTVLAGVSLGIALNHGVAILIAVFISQHVPLEALQIVSAFVFLAFGLKSLWLDFEEEEEEEKFKEFGPVLTVAATFFLGEFGDKTQITAMTLAANSPKPFFIFLSTVSAMILVSLLGIFVGKVLGKKIPEVTMQLIAAGLFLFFGVSSVYDYLPAGRTKTAVMTVLIVALFLAAALILYRNSKEREKYLAGSLSRLLEGCKHCDRHDPHCPRAMKINALTEEYLGEEIPYLGNLISYLEGMGKVSSGKRNRLARALNVNRR